MAAPVMQPPCSILKKLVFALLITRKQKFSSSFQKPINYSSSLYGQNVKNSHHPIKENPENHRKIMKIFLSFNTY